MNWMRVHRRRVPGALLLGVVSAATVAVAVAQVRSAENAPQSAQVARNQALVQSVARLESDNRDLRHRVSALNSDLAGLENDAASLSADYQAALIQLNAERAAAGLLPAAGDGVQVTLDSGPDPNTPGDRSSRWLVGYQDLEDLVNTLWRGGAEGVSVNGERVVATTAFFQVGAQVGVSTGLPLSLPLRVSATGNPEALQSALATGSGLADLRLRRAQYRLEFSWEQRSGMDLAGFGPGFALRYAQVAT
ncbi:MAG: DUF881 domain-containing protein [Candidatus Dormibacteria bacterium]